MRRLPRIPLPARVFAALASYGGALAQGLRKERKKKAPDIRRIVDAAWAQKRSTKALEVVDLALDAMASGVGRCMYCEDSRGCDIEHFRPKAHYPDRAFDWPNLLKVCADCNRQKNERFDEQLLDPTVDEPSDHLLLSLHTGRYVAREESAKGMVTARVLRRLVADPTLARGRLNVWVELKNLLRAYDDHRASGRAAEAEEIRSALVEKPFSAVFEAVVCAGRETGAGDVLGQDVVAILSRHPDMAGWLAHADDARVRAAQPKIDELTKGVRIVRASRRRRA